MNLTNLSIFMQVVQKGSFADTARDIDVDPSKISRIISALEDELGYRLFHRTTRKLSLTEAGQLTYERMRDPLEEINAIVDMARASTEKLSGNLRLTTSIALGERWLVPKLGKFYEQYPDIKLELILDDRAIDLIDQRIDVALRLAPQTQSDLITTRIMRARYHVVATPEFLQKNGACVSPKDIQYLKIITFPYADYRLLWKFRAPNGEISQIPISPHIVISNALAIRRTVLEGQGMALLSDWLIGDDLASGDLVDVFPEHQISAENFDEGVWLTYPSKRYLPSNTRALIDFLKQNQN
ncbi:MAG: LysR family transcriptional regulator [Lentilitoribacter sp.]